MIIPMRQLVTVLLLASMSAAAIADDCSGPKNAMLTSGQTPHALTITKSDAKGKTSVAHEIQTVDNKYVQSFDSSKWYAMNIAIKDLSVDEFKSAKFACQADGPDIVNGVPVSVYQVQMTSDGEVMNTKIWISSKGLIQKSEKHLEGATLSVSYDYSHVVAPTQSTSLGK